MIENIENFESEAQDREFNTLDTYQIEAFSSEKNTPYIRFGGRVVSVAAASAILFAACGGGSEANQPKETITPDETATTIVESTPTNTLTNTPTIEVTPSPTATPVETPTPGEELTPYELFLKESEEYVEAVEEMTINKELIEALRTPNNYGVDLVSKPYPDYSNLTDEEVEKTFKDFTTSFWGEGLNIMLTGPDLSSGINKWLHSLNMIALWGQSGYIAEEDLESWQAAYTEGREALGRTLNLIQDEKARIEMDNYFKDYFQQDLYQYLEKGEVNPDMNPITGVEPVRTPIDIK